MCANIRIKYYCPTKVHKIFAQNVVRLNIFYTFAYMIELIEAGWNITIYRQKKRRQGEFVTLLQWSARKQGTLREHTNEGMGFDTAKEAVDNMITYLTTLP